MPPAGRRTDDGISLAELILAVALLGTAAVTLLGAFGTLIKTGDQSRKSGDLTTGLAAAAEFVVDGSRTTFVDCAQVADYQTSVDAAPAGVVPATIGAVTVMSVAWWDDTVSDFVPSGATCPAAARNSRLQRVTLRLTSTNGTEREITVVKRG